MNEKTEYKSKGGLILKDSRTPDGYYIKSGEDLITYLEGLPAFETVATAFIVEAMAAALEERKEYDSPQDFAEYVAERFI